nr:hypothetical protein [Tanacetum cinerariifolium]
MAEEGCFVEVAVIFKFDMPHHRSTMSPKDVKLLARKYNIPLDLHRCAPFEGWTMDKLIEEAIGLYEQFFDFYGALAGRVIDLRPVYPGLTFAVAGSESRPPMLNKENYVPWSSRLLRYAKSRPNGKLIHNSLLNGPYVRRMISEPGDANREVTVIETFHVQTDDELSDKELKQIEADDQAIQTILLGLPEDIYVAVDSYDELIDKELKQIEADDQTITTILLGLLEDIYDAEKKAKLFNEWERFTSNEGESIESYYHRFLNLMNDLKRNKHFPEKIASNLKFLNNLQREWSRHVTIVHQTKDLHTADYTQLYDFLKYNQKEVDELKAERLAKTQDPLALIRMILEPGDANREVNMIETFHLQTDDELSDKKLKQIEADDQAIQTILLGLPEDIYAAVDSCETAQEIWLRVQQMMKGSDIGIQEKKAKLFNECQNGVDMLPLFIRPRICTQLITLNSPHQDQPSFNQNYLQQPMTNPEDITDPTTAMNLALALMAKAFKLNYSTPTNNNQRISSNLRNRQIAQPGMNMGHDRQMQMVGGNGRNQFRQYAGQNTGNPAGYNYVIGNQVIQNVVPNPRIQNVRNQNGLIGVQRNGNQNQIRNGNLVAA